MNHMLVRKLVWRRRKKDFSPLHIQSKSRNSLCSSGKLIAFSQSKRCPCQTHDELNLFYNFYIKLSFTRSFSSNLNHSVIPKRFVLTIHCSKRLNEVSRSLYHQKSLKIRFYSFPRQQKRSLIKGETLSLSDDDEHYLFLTLRCMLLLKSFVSLHNRRLFSFKCFSYCAYLIIIFIKRNDVSVVALEID